MLIASSRRAALAPEFPSSPETKIAGADAAAIPVAPGIAPAPGNPADAAPMDFVTDVRTLARVAACAPTGEIPERFDSKIVESHCKALASLEDIWTRRWLAHARPFLDHVVPANLPTSVVYPFGGGDLLTALVTFPGAAEITTLSLEPAGDPRAIDALPPSDLTATLAEVRQKVNHLFAIGHSKTTDMGKMAKSKLPGDLTYSLVALTLCGLEPVSVKFFRIGPGGEPRYLTKQDLDGDVGSGRHSIFASMEIAFQAHAGGPRRIFRHIAANLDDTHLKADPSVLRHLEAKGEIAAITKAASYLLWWKEFGQIRGYLLHNMVWMISDSTGIPPDEAHAAGFEQIPFGHFDGPFLGGGNRPTDAFKKLWADEAQPLGFRFGYPDSTGHDHLLITRRQTAK